MTHSATWDSCSLVRFSGWLKARMPKLLGSAPGGRLALSTALFITLMKAPTLCHPLLLNHTWEQEAGSEWVTPSAPPPVPPAGHGPGPGSHLHVVLGVQAIDETRQAVQEAVSGSTLRSRSHFLLALHNNNTHIHNHTLTNTCAQTFCSSKIFLMRSMASSTSWAGGSTCALRAPNEKPPYLQDRKRVTGHFHNNRQKMEN